MEKKRVENFQDLVVWQNSHELVQTIVNKTKKFPKKDLNILGRQLCQNSALLPIHIARGFKKRNTKNKSYFYREALFAIETIRYEIILTSDLGIYQNAGQDLEKCDQIERMMKRLIRSVTSKS
jgi:four helix bundle protein